MHTPNVTDRRCDQSSELQIFARALTHLRCGVLRVISTTSERSSFYFPALVNLPTFNVTSGVDPNETIVTGGLSGTETQSANLRVMLWSKRFSQELQ